MKLILPKKLLKLFNQENGFTSDELLDLISTDEETKNFLKELKPIILAYLKKEFPIINLLNL